MASRHHSSRVPSTSASTAAATAPSNSLNDTTAQAPPNSNHAMPSNSVRRNLFHHHLSRRPASTTSSAPTVNGSNTSVNGPSGLSRAPQLPSTSLSSSQPSDNGDIVPRDKNGGYKVETPPMLPGMAGDDMEEGSGMEGIEAGTQNCGAVGEGEMTEREKESMFHICRYPSHLG